MQSHAFRNNGQLRDSQNTLHYVTLHAEAYFLFHSFPILRFFKFYYRKGILGLIISHCPLQSLGGAKTTIMRTKMIHRWQTTIKTFCSKQRKSNRKQKHFKHFSCLTNYKNKTLCKIQEANIFLWSNKNVNNLKFFQHCINCIMKACMILFLQTNATSVV